MSAGQATVFTLLVLLMVALFYQARRLDNDRRHGCESRDGVWLSRDGVCLDKRLTK